MTYNKYNIENSVKAQFSIGIGASTTTINLKTGEGTQFPTTNAIIKFVQYNTPGDTTSGIAKTCSAFIVGKSGDTLTVTRSFGGTTATTYLADDYIYLTNDKAVIEDIQAELEQVRTDYESDVSSLEGSKLDKDGELRTGNGTYKTTYNNVNGDEVELSHGADGTVLTSNGATDNPTWLVPSVAIGSLAEDTSPEYNEYAIIYTASGNRKVKIENIIKGEVYLVVGESVTQGQSLCIKTDGKAYKTNTANSDYIKFIGFAEKTISSGGTVQIVPYGVNDKQTGLVAGTDYVLDTGTWIEQGGVNHLSGKISSNTKLTDGGIAISPDGKYFYSCDDGGNDINQYEMATPYNLSTTGTSLYDFSISTIGGETEVNGFSMSRDGRYMFIVGSQIDAVIQYYLSTPFMLSSMSDTGYRYYATSQRDVVLSDDGTKMYLSMGGTIKSYNLSTAWNVSSASLWNSASILARGIHFSEDGKILVCADSNGFNVYHYILSTAWDISTRGTVTTKTTSFSHYIDKVCVIGKYVYLANRSDDTSATTWDYVTTPIVGTIGIEQNEENEIVRVGTAVASTKILQKF